MRYFETVIGLALVGCSGGDFGSAGAVPVGEPDASAGRSGAASGGIGEVVSGAGGDAGSVAAGGTGGTVPSDAQAGSGGVPEGGATASPEAGVGGSEGGSGGTVGGAGGTVVSGGAGGSEPICPSGWVFCDDRCRDGSQPLWGCDGSCQPCPWGDVTSGGEPICVSGKCRAECPEGWQPNPEHTGCELVPCSAGEIRCDSGEPCAAISIFNGCGHALCQPCLNLNSACCKGNVCGMLNGEGVCL